MRGLAILMLGLAAGAPAATADEPPAPKVEWLARPDAQDVFKCFKLFHKGEQVHEGVVMMRCATAPGDHIANCVVTSGADPDDERYEMTAICAARAFRMRATGPDGKPVMGVSVNVPFRFASSQSPPAVSTPPK